MEFYKTVMGKSIGGDIDSVITEADTSYFANSTI